MLSLLSEALVNYPTNYARGNERELLTGKAPAWLSAAGMYVRQQQARTPALPECAFRKGGAFYLVPAAAAATTALAATVNFPCAPPAVRKRFTVRDYRLLRDIFLSPFRVAGTESLFPSIPVQGLPSESDQKIPAIVGCNRAG